MYCPALPFNLRGSLFVIRFLHSRSSAEGDDVFDAILLYLDIYNGSDKERKTQLALPKTLSFPAIRSIESEFFQTVFGLKSQIQFVPVQK